MENQIRRANFTVRMVRRRFEVVSRGSIDCFDGRELGSNRRRFEMVVGGLSDGDRRWCGAARSSDRESYSGIDRFAQIHSPVRLRFCNLRLGCGMGFTVGFRVFVLMDGGIGVGRGSSALWVWLAR